MKYLIFYSILICSAVTFGQSKKDVIAENDSLKKAINTLLESKKEIEAENKAYVDKVKEAGNTNDTARYMYLIGVMVGNQLSSKNFGEIEYNNFYKGFYDGYNENLEKAPIEYSSIVGSTRCNNTKVNKAKV